MKAMSRKWKRWLSVLLIAVLAMLPAFSSYAEEAAPSDFSQENSVWRFLFGQGFDLASPSDLMRDIAAGANTELELTFIPDKPANRKENRQEGAKAAGFSESEAPDAAEFGTEDVVREPAEESVSYGQQEASPEELTAENTASAETGTYVKLLVYNIDYMPSGDELLAGYIDSLFTGEPADPLIQPDYWRSLLGGDEEEFYDSLKEFAEDIAAHDEDCPVFEPADAAPSARYGREELGLPPTAANDEWCEAALNRYLQDVINVNRVVNSVYRDNPFDFYWAGGSYAVFFNAAIDGGYCEVNMASLYFPVEDDYEGSFTGTIGAYPVCSVDNEEIRRARYAAGVAWEIVEEHRGESDAEMLTSFSEELNELITGEKEPYSTEWDDPWMLVYVFDTDPLTTVSEEVAYSKALQALCDMSGR